MRWLCLWSVLLLPWSVWAMPQETRHDVRVDLDATGALTYHVTRTFRSDTTRELRLDVPLPPGGVATDLTLRGCGSWCPHVRLAPKDARARHHARGKGTSTMLQWIQPQTLELRVYPVRPKTPVTVSYRLHIPTTYRQGRYLLPYPVPPRKDTHLVTPTMRLASSTRGTLTDAAGVGVNRAHLLPRVKVDYCGKGCVAHKLKLEEASAYSLELRAELTHREPKTVTLRVRSPRGAIFELTRTSPGDTWRVTVPAKDAVAGTWRIEARDHWRGGHGVLRTWSLSAAHRAGALDAYIPDEGDSPKLLAASSHVFRFSGAVWALTPPPTTRAHYGVACGGEKHCFARVSLSLSSALSSIPKKPQVVFVLDHSRSLSDADVQAQWDVIEAYLGHVPDASVQVVAFARKARALWPKFLSAHQARRSIAAARRLPRANGSHLEGGLALARTLLQGVPGPARLIVLSDGQMRAGFDPKAASKALGPARQEQILHVVHAVRGRGELEVTPTDVMEEVAVPHAGRAWFLPAQVELERDRVALERASLELVRPLRLDGLELEGWAGKVPRTLAEGEALTLQSTSLPAPEALLVRGRLWAKPVQFALRPGRRASADAAAFAFSTRSVSAWPKEIKGKLSELADVVTPFHASWSGTPAGTPGPYWRPRGLYGFGGIGGVHVRSTSCPGMTPPLPKIALDVSSCGPAQGATYALEVETDGVEVLDVRPARPPANDRERCVVEAAWALELGAPFAHTRGVQALSM